jgi:hypothetical protein
MKIRILFLLLTLLVFVTSVNAQWFENGKPATEKPWLKIWGKYGAQFELTDKPNELFSAWQKPAAGIPVSTTEIAKRGEPVVGVVFFAGCATDDNGFCNATVTFQVFKPDGSPYNEEQVSELWIGKAPPPYGKLQLSKEAIGVIIEPSDPNGVYTVRAFLKDKISKAEVELIRTFRVFPGE